ncbi:hypothetical protein DXG01_015422 [Tephrocybe rancida]|nr:hypothetical protein DXG01_015422 [Tephrocybe rancida]
MGNLTPLTRNILMHSVVVNGNFKADYVRQSPPKTGKESITTSGWVKGAMLLSKACDVKGIVALARAQHGCFIPTYVADLPAVEQQKNIDYILWELFWNGNFGEVQRIPFMYNIVCQYIVHLAKHLGTDIPEHLTIDQAIGLMHVHGHKDDCFRRFASSFIPGAAITAGEILETLWASLNRVSSQAWTATLAH